MRKSYPGEAITVSFDADVCQHSGNCVRGLSAVFNNDQRPWIQPDKATVDEVIAQVGRCPSGALRIEDDGETAS